jgi:hypothetical protein
MSFLDDAAKQLLYQDQITNLRNGLLGNGPTNGHNKADLDSMKYFLEVKALAAVMVFAETKQAEKADKANTSYYQQLEDFNKNSTIADEVKSQGVANDTTKKYYDDLLNTGPRLVDESQQVAPLDPEKGATQFVPANSAAKMQTPDNVQAIIDKNPDAEAKTKKFFTESNVNATPPSGAAGDGTLPIPGEAVKTQDGSYGQAMSNSLKFSVPDGNGGTRTYFKSWATKDNKPDPNTHGTPDEPYTDKLNAMLEEQRQGTPGSYKFFIEKLHGKSIDGKFYRKNEITPGMTRDQIPNRMVFPAYIMNFNDSYALSWADYKFIGRGEKVYIYEETTRSMALEFWMMSDFSADLLIKAIEDYQKLTTGDSQSNSNSKLDATTSSLSKTQNTPPGNLFDASGKAHEPDKQPVEDSEKLKELQRIRPDWGEGTTPNSSYTRGDKTGFVQGQYSGTPEQFWARSTFLAQCCYAWYRKDGKLKEQPFVRIRIGDFFDVIAKIDSLDFTNEDFDMDLNSSVVGAIPMGVRVAMRLTIVHEDEATSEYPRFYHRKDFDGLNVNPYALPENLQETSKNMDSTLDKNESKSPVASISGLTDYGKAQTEFPKDQKAVQESLKSFGGSLKDLQDSAGSLKDLKKGEKLKEALKNAKRLLDISKLFDVEKIKDVKKHIDVGDIPPLKNPTSLANTPIADSFPPVAVPKVQDIPEKGQSLFPQFKNAKTT